MLISDGHIDAHLLCRTGTIICALPLPSVRETMRPLPIAPLAGVPPFVLGVAIIRGAPTPVIDTGRLLGTPGSFAARFVTTNVLGRISALAVDSVLGVRALPDSSLAELPPLLHDVGAESVVALGVLDASLLMLLETSRMVPEPVWSALEATHGRT
jgi:purine-binding chemotaxis protein CheW